jgi:uncharacterized protein YjiS (DUF1127 family)
MLNQEDAMDLVPDRRGTAAWARKAGALDWSLASASPAVALRRVGRVAAALGTWIAGALARRRQRLDLSELNDHLLKDIGLSRSAAQAEATKPFWRFNSPS